MIGYGSDEVSIMSVVYPHALVIVSSLGYFLSVGYSYKTFHCYLPLSLVERNIQKFSTIIG